MSVRICIAMHVMWYTSNSTSALRLPLRFSLLTKDPLRREKDEKIASGKMQCCPNTVSKGFAFSRYIKTSALQPCPTLELVTLGLARVEEHMSATTSKSTGFGSLRRSSEVSDVLAVKCQLYR